MNFEDVDFTKVRNLDGITQDVLDAAITVCAQFPNWNADYVVRIVKKDLRRGYTIPWIIQNMRANRDTHLKSMKELK